MTHKKRTEIKFVFLMLFVGVSWLAPTLTYAAESDNAAWLVEAADKAQQAGDVERTIRLLEAYQQIANKPDVWLRLGSLLEQQSRFTEAIDALEKYQGNEAKTAEDVRQRIRLLSLKDDPRFFRASFREAQRIPDLARRAFSQGRKLVLAKRYQSGIGYLQAAALLDPNLPGPYRLLGATYIQLGRSQNAQRHLAEYLRIRPDGVLANKVRKLLDGRHVLGRLDLNASFPCSIWINGRAMRKSTPSEGILLPQGTHIVAFVSEKHHLVKTFRIRIDADRRHIVNFRYGVLKVKLDPWGRVRANGRDLGLWEELGLPAGRYDIEASSHDGSKSKKTVLEVEPGKELELGWKNFTTDA